MSKIVFRFSVITEAVSKSIATQTAEIVAGEFSKARQELINDSPQGVSEQQGRPSLSKSWVLASGTKNGEFRAQITNEAPNALYRLEGRRGGKAPPLRAILEWVRLKLKPGKKAEFPIAKKIRKNIAQKGTVRSKRNFKQFDPKTGDPAKNGAIDKAKQRITKRLLKLSKTIFK